MDWRDAMNWFTRMCRQAGLAIHNVSQPSSKSKQQIRKTTQEKKIDAYTTLRRTTIDEIEVRSEKNSDANPR